MRSVGIDVVTDDTALARLAEDWTALRAVTPHASAFQSFPWIAAHREILGSHGRQLQVIVVRDGGAPVAIIPCDLGRRGDLRFLGGSVSNYQGPVHRPDAVGDLVAGLATLVGMTRSRVRLLDLGGLPERAPFLDALRSLRLPGWSSPTLVRTATCPYVDLAGGWSAVRERRTSASWRQVARKWKALGRLGRLTFVESVDPADVQRLLPEMFTLFRQRWTGRHESGGFAGRYRAFHERAAPMLVAAGEARISFLELDGRLAAFYYAVAADGGTASYVIGHDDVLAPFSPGLLVLTRILEAACGRGEPEFDLSLGEEGYKKDWASGARGVFRVLAWRRGSAALNGRLRAVGAQAWVRARSVGWLRDVRREGFRRALFGAPSGVHAPDTPGLAAGDGGRWTVHRMPPGGATSGPGVLRTWSYAELRALGSPRLAAIAADRCYRGDPLLAVYRAERLLGVLWRACPARRALVTQRHEPPPSEPVYYHPIATNDDPSQLVAALATLDEARSGFTLVTHAPRLPGISSRIEASFDADVRFAAPVRTRAARRAHAVDVSSE